MKNITKICLGLVLVVALGSCTDDFDEVNTDPKNFIEENVTQGEYPLFVKRAIYTPNNLPFPEGRGAFQLAHSLFTDTFKPHSLPIM